MKYANLGGNSNVVAFDLGENSIEVQFGDGSVYLYTTASAGAYNISEMKRLASQGWGLNSFINKNVKTDYASKRP